MAPDLEAIRARREHLRLSLVRTSEHFEQGAYELRHNAITDIDALLAEVERLTCICKATNPCSYCGTLQLISREGEPVIGDPLTDLPAGHR